MQCRDLHLLIEQFAPATTIWLDVAVLGGLIILANKDSIPRNDYPRPQWQREGWQNLNGIWEFCFDDRNDGIRQQWWIHGPFDREIVVPYPFQSELSTVHDSSIHDVIWYRRRFSLEQLKDRYVLHVGAVDYFADIWVNGQWIGHHEGGHTDFSVDISPMADVGDENVVVIRAQDITKDLSQPRGKQFWEEKSRGIFYTRTSGIWQTVWIEATNNMYLERGDFLPDIDQHSVDVSVVIGGEFDDEDTPYRMEISISYAGEILVSDLAEMRASTLQRSIRLPDKDFARERLWSPENPNLYTVRLTLWRENRCIDAIDSYFGMRKISVHEGHVFLNNRPYKMKLVLDQGYFPGGILTAPTDQDYKVDIELVKNMGFNGVRKHQKIEDPRYLYWADHLGLIVWEEMPSAYQFSRTAMHRIASEWYDVLLRDMNHPCIVAWVPLNESWGVPDLLTSEPQRAFATSLYYLTKAVDPSRLVVSNDGWEHTISDLLTIHDYSGDEDELRVRYSSVEQAMTAMPGGRMLFVGGYGYNRQPILVTEFGGIAYQNDDNPGWGYTRADDADTFVKRLMGVFGPMNTSSIVDGYCYTQLTDVEQEINGLLRFDRNPKAPIKLIRAIVENRLTDSIVSDSK